MKCDMELIRKLMFKLEEIDGAEPFPSTGIEIDGYDAQQISYHCQLLRDRGFIDTGTDWQIGGQVYFSMFIQRLTYPGHEFIATIRNDTLWTRTVTKAKEQGISLTIELASQFIKSIARDMLGIH